MCRKMNMSQTRHAGRRPMIQDCHLQVQYLLRSDREHRYRTEIQKPSSKIADSWGVVEGILRASVRWLVVVAWLNRDRGWSCVLIHGH
jgi:hypothetical protein